MREKWEKILAKNKRKTCQSFEIFSIISKNFQNLFAKSLKAIYEKIVEKFKQILNKIRK